MRRAKEIILTVLVMLATTAQAGWFDRGVKGSGDMVTESREVGEFDRIETSGSWDVEVVVGDQRSLKLTFDDNIIELIRTEVDDGTLEIYCEESFSTRRNCKVEIMTPSLTEISSRGSGDISVERIEADRFDFDLSGSGDFDLNGHCREMMIHLAGSGDGTLSGEADVVDIRVSGSGDIDAVELKAKEAFVRVSGSGDVDVSCSELFDGRVSGSGDIAYYGKPSDVNTSVSGSGGIRRR